MAEFFFKIVHFVNNYSIFIFIIVHASVLVPFVEEIFVRPKWQLIFSVITR